MSATPDQGRSLYTCMLNHEHINYTEGYDILTCGDGTAKKIVGKVSIPQNRMTVVANAVITIQVLTLTDPEPIAMLHT